MDKIYLGNGKEFFDGDEIKISLNLTKLKEAAEHIFEFKGNKYIKLKVCKKKEIDEYGKTHYVQVDTFKPDFKPKQEEEDIPF